MSITLFKGDDSDFAGLRTISVALNSPFDMTGWKALLEVQGIRLAVADVSDGAFVLEFSDRDTRALKLGECLGALSLFDGAGRRKTLAKAIPFTVVDSVDENTDDELTFEITVDAQTVELSFESSTVGAETLGNKVSSIDLENPSELEYPSTAAVAALLAPADGNLRIDVTGGAVSLKLLDVHTGTFHPLYFDSSSGTRELKW